MFHLVLFYMGGAYALERVPSDNLTAQGVDACPSGTEHLPRLTGLDWSPPPIPHFGASNKGHGKCAGLFKCGWEKAWQHRFPVAMLERKRAQGDM